MTSVNFSRNGEYFASGGADEQVTDDAIRHLLPDLLLSPVSDVSFYYSRFLVSGVED